jgi:hypothetical protein
MCRNDRAGAHTDVQHHRPQRVIRVADPQRDVALTGEGEAIRLELTVDYFLIDHDTVSRVGKPLANLISEAPRLFLELTKRLPLPKKEVPGAKLRIGLRPNRANMHGCAINKLKTSYEDSFFSTDFLMQNRILTTAPTNNRISKASEPAAVV